MATSVTTAWLSPTTVSTPSWNSNVTTWTNATGALGLGGSSATSPLESGDSYKRGVSVWLTPSGSSADSEVPNNGNGLVIAKTITSYEGSPLTYSQLTTQLRVAPWARFGAGAGFNNSQLNIGGFDVAGTVPSDATIEKLEWRLYYSLSTTQFDVDYAEVRITYSAAPQSVSPSSITGGEAFDSPSFSPGITYVGIDSVLPAENFGSLQANMQIQPDTVPASEAFGLPTTTIFAATLGDIASQESVSNVSFTTQFITVAEIPSEETIGTLLNTMFMSALGDITTEAALEAPTIIQAAPPPPPPTDWSAVGKQDEKVYLYKVSKHDGTYVGVWADVADNLEFTERINAAGTSTTVHLSRSANTTRETRAALLTQSGDKLTTEDGAQLISVYQTPNVVGEDTDVDLNYNVDIYVHYGEFARLVTQLGEPITTEDGDNIMVMSGAPLGIRVFSGYVLDYEAVYGDDAGVWVTLVSHGNELSDQVVKSGANTNVTFTTSELSSITKSVLDTNPGVMGYTGVSLPATGVTQTMKFQLNTKLEAIQSIFEQTPDGWYWYGDVAENNLYMRPVSAGYDHTFVIGRHIKNLRVRRTMEGLKNLVYFVGGQTDPNDAATTVFKKYENTTSQTAWRVGLERITDRRYILASSMAARANKTLGSGSSPVFTTQVEISSGRYDLESFKIGQTVGFKNAGNYIDEIPPLVIVSRRYTPTAVTLELGARLERQVDTLSDVESSLYNEQYQNLPNAPS